MSTPELQSVLIRARLLTPELVAVGVTATAGTGTSWLEHLVHLELVDDRAIARCAAQAAFVPACRAAHLVGVPPEVLDQVPWDLAIEHRVVPIAVDDDGDVSVAMIDPYDRSALAQLEFFLHRRMLREVAPLTAIAWALTNYYRAPAPVRLVATRAAPMPSVLRARPTATMHLVPSA
jgi:Type II secretion system (T2SS), protein E, N-terminal domain